MVGYTFVSTKNALKNVCLCLSSVSIQATCNLKGGVLGGGEVEQSSQDKGTLVKTSIFHLSKQSYKQTQQKGKVTAVVINVISSMVRL